MEHHPGATGRGGIFESHDVVLRLLAGPTQRAVSCLRESLIKTSHCSVVNTYRIPYDDDVFAASKGQGSELPFSQLPQDWDTFEQEQKPYNEGYVRPIGMAAIRTITSPYMMGLTVARNMSLACLNLAHKHILLLTEAEERAIETGKEPDYIPFPWDDLPEALRNGGRHSGMDIAVLSVRGLLDWSAGKCFSQATSVKMHTDLRRTAKDMLKEYSPWQRVPRVIKTSLFSEMTLFASEWAFSCVLDVTRLLLNKRDRVVKRILIKIGMHGARCSSLWVAVSLGNGIGSSSPKLQPLFMLACANMCSFLVNTFFASLTRRIEDTLDISGDDCDGKKGSGGGGGMGHEPFSNAGFCTSFPQGLASGPESPDVITPMPSEPMESPVASIAFNTSAGDISSIQPSPLTHTISSKGPRLPPRRKITLPADADTDEQNSSDRVD